MKKRTANQTFGLIGFCILGTVLCVATALAADPPQVKRSSDRISVSYWPDAAESVPLDGLFEAIDKEVAQTVPEKRSFDLSGMNDAVLAKICETYPEIKGLKLDNSRDGSNGFVGITTLNPLKKLTKLTEVELKSFGKPHDITLEPLMAATGLEKLEIEKMKGVDLAAVGKLSSLKHLALRSNGVSDISWVSSLSNLNYFTVNIEPIADFSPIAKTPVVSMGIISCKDVNLTFLNGMPTLTHLTLRNVEKPINWQELGKLPNLKTLTLESIAAKGGDPVDLSFLAKLPKLTHLYLAKSTVSNFEAITNCSTLTNIALDGTQGVTTLVPIKPLENLSSVTVSKGAFSEDDLSGFKSKRLKQPLKPR